MNSPANELAMGKAPGGPGIGHNSRPIDLTRERVEELARAANDWAKRVMWIADDATAQRAADFLTQITAEIAKVESEHKRENEPHLKAGREVDLAYEPIERVLIFAKSLISPKITDWLIRKQRAAELAKRRQAEQAEALQRQADAAAQKAASGQGDVVGNMVRATELAAAATEATKEAAAPPDRAQVRGTYGSRARSLRTLWRAEVEDVLMAFCHFQCHPDVLEVLTKLANADAPAAHREGREIPGCRLVSREISA